MKLSIRDLLPKRRWFQFSLKAMLLVLTLVSITLAWLAYEQNEVRKREEAIAAIEKLGGEVEFDLAQPFRPIWLRPLLGDKSPGEVVRVDFSETVSVNSGESKTMTLHTLPVLRDSKGWTSAAARKSPTPAWYISLVVRN